MNDLLAKFRGHSLDPGAPYKPLDFGAHGITGSINQDGRITAINAYHPTYGYGTLTSADPFPEEERYNAAVVRVYRAGLVQLTGFGLRFSQPVVSRQAWLIEDAIPHIRLELANGAIAEVTTFIPLENPIGVVQLWRFSGPDVQIHSAGKLSLQRCAYTQLTEGGPIPTPPAQAHIFSQREHAFGIENTEMQWAAFLHGSGAVEQSDGTTTFPDSNSLTLTPLSGDEAGGVFVVALGQTPAEAEGNFDTLTRESDLMAMLDRTLTTWQNRWQGWSRAGHPLDGPLRRALVYSLHCCVPAPGEKKVPDAVCIMTDHQLLPLEWNRDSYYAAMALFHWREDCADLVRGHLIWMFEVAERPEGYWARSYMVNGKVKDAIFQLDQQSFPLLQWAEYVKATGDSALGQRLAGPVQTIVEMLLARRDKRTGLIATEETASDDIPKVPYSLASHLLLWHALREINPLVNIPALASIIEQLEQAIWRYFVTKVEGRRMFAFMTDGAGQFDLYHDANDIPLVMAPVWGFCPADNPTWRATIDFAFSPANEGGYYAGQYGSLGSIHTPGGWPLGDGQELVIAWLTGNKTREQHVVERMVKAALWDGAFPEAYDQTTAVPVSRHWFAWPGAALALLYLRNLDH